MSILIRNVLLQDNTVDIFIKGNRFHKIGNNLDVQADTIIEGKGKAIFPSFVNGHTHAAMTLLRGYAEDMELHTWLNQYIWPMEGNLSEEDVYVGAKLACLEMIKTGTTFFNDMYWHYTSTARAVEEMGIRAALSSVFIDFNNPELADKHWQECLDLYQKNREYSSRVIFAMGPHAIYSVSRDSLEKIRDFSQEHNVLIHLHLSETQKEAQDAYEHFGLTPVEYLQHIGLLGPRLCACHAVWLTPKEMDILAEHQVKVIHNPVSNLKLCSGFFPYKELRDRDITIGLGTDGCSSNNNLDILEEMKFASLVAKSQYQDPTLMPAQETFNLATLNGARIFDLDGGEIIEGKLADCILVNLNHHQMTPDYNLISNLVYAMNGGGVDTTICDGQILMQDRKVKGEDEIIAQAKETAHRLVKQTREQQN